MRLLMFGLDGGVGRDFRFASERFIFNDDARKSAFLA